MDLLVDASIASALTGATDCVVLIGECDEPLVATSNPDGSVRFTAASSDLVPNESLTVAIAFELGTFEPGAVVISLFAGTTQAADRSRRTGPSDIIVPQYTPPDGLNVMVAAYIAGRPERAFAAQIVSLAVRDNVRLLDCPTRATAPSPHN